jgi:agmatine deiminase
MTNPYRMPAEWEPQAAMWLSWPHNEETWPENLDRAQAEFVDLVRMIARFQPVKILSAGEAHQQAQRSLGSVERLELVPIPTNDAWARDYAPTFVKDRATGQLHAVNWHYNAWGGKYPPFDQDQLVASRVAQYLDIPLVSPDLCFEGGGIEVNQSGLMLCTRSCALDPNRNPGKSMESIEGIFRQMLGVEQIVWLNGDAIEGDDTDGHIDQLARFVNEETIVYAWSDDPQDPQRQGLQENLEDLKTGLSRAGRSKTRLVPLAIPPRRELHGRAIPASYCNFLIGNGWVAVPQFDAATQDQRAVEILTKLFPDRKVLALDSLNLTVGLGSFHCLSQQQPA